MHDHDAMAEHDWASRWIAAIANGTLTMSQRKLASVETKGGGVEHVTAVARAASVHLAIFVDDQGDQLLVASLHPIRVLC